MSAVVVTVDGERRRERSDSRGPARERTPDRERSADDGDVARDDDVSDNRRRREDAPKVPVTTVRDAAT
ncbi:MAG: hypothetical protein ACKO2R_00630, partial [Actinomycetota bacterium]